MAYVIYEGTTIRFYTKQVFKDLAGTPVDPDVVEFQFEIQGGNKTTYTYTWETGDPTNNIVRTGVGNYYIDRSTVGLPGVWAWRIYGYPSAAINHDTSKTQVAWEGDVTVSAKGIS
jgi:hypothetical protein